MKYFYSGGVRQTYHIDGRDDAPTVVMVNSLGTDLHMWDAQVALLSPTMRVIRYDCRGHGASEGTASTMEQFGLDLLALLDTLQINHVALCGLSLGGMIALWFSLQYPQRVTKAIFANTAARIGNEELWNARIDAVRTGGMAAIRDAVLARFLSERFRRLHPEITQQIGAMVEAIDPHGYIGACRVLRDTDLHPMVKTLRVPSLILTGELDLATPPSQAQELHAAIAGSQLIVMNGVAHLSNVEQPETFCQHVQNFLLSAGADT